MSEHNISSEDADLLLHRFITELVPVDIWFASADGFVTVNMEGFISAFKDGELHIITDLKNVGNFVILRHIPGSICTYADDTDLPNSKFCLGLNSVLKW